jgi:hypothetical protein
VSKIKWPAAASMHFISFYSPLSMLGQLIHAFFSGKSMKDKNLEQIIFLINALD